VRRQGVRVVFHGNGIPAGLRGDRPAFAGRIMAEQEDAIVSVTRIPYKELQTAQGRTSVVCAACAEPVMETRVRETENGPVCIPCAERSTI
jgi:formylmethanofuran dehydrogenase subunit E